MVMTLLSSQMVHARLYGKQYCKKEGFHCVRVKKHQSWQSLFPDDHDRDIVMRINRMNIQLWPGLSIAVPDNLAEADIMDFSPFPLQIDTEGEKLIVVDPIQIAWGAYDSDGALIRWGPASSGATWCHDIDGPCRTQSGEFRVYSMGSSNCISKKFPLPDGGAPMPYCMFFHNGQALHGEPNGLPGYNASHGCVRMYVNDVAWLRFDFVDPPMAENDFRGTKIVVTEYAEPEEIQESQRHFRKGEFDLNYFSPT